MNASELIQGQTYCYLTPGSRMLLEFERVVGEGGVTRGQFEFRTQRGLLRLPLRHVEEFVWREQDLEDRVAADSDLEAAGRSAFHAFYRIMGHRRPDGSFLPAWPDLLPKERAAWRAAAMDGHQSYQNHAQPPKVANSHE